jgi:hypothetical protein
MSDADRHLFGIVGAAVLCFSPATVVVAAEYLSIDAAQRAIFPEADAFIPVLPALTLAQKQHIATLAGQQPPHGTLSIWRATRSGANVGYVFIDEVLGRSDLITYGLGMDGAGQLRAIEILSYRESHGGEIRNVSWRKQFANRHGLDELVFRTDIKNISGATLSSEHVTQGVRWLVALWQTALAEP